MPKIPEPFTIPRRSDSKTFQITLNYTAGLPERVCREWRRRSFQDFPVELAEHRNPKTKAAAKAGAYALIAYLKQKMEERSTDAQRVRIEDITAGAWIEKFTKIETSPKAALNATRNRPNSIDTIENYKNYYDNHVKGDPFTKLLMSEIEENDIVEYVARLSVKRLSDGRPAGGTRTFAGVIGFIRMTFRLYQKMNRRWINPFMYIDSPTYHYIPRDALTEDEVVKLFFPGVLRNTMELAVCAIMFLSGLRRSEIYALKPECLDWHTPKILVKNAWQCYNRKTRVLGPTKSKKPREAPFDPILQAAIKKLWEENGEHEFVFCRKSGRTPGSSWLNRNLPLWLECAGIDLAGRDIVPHSARHSLASLLEERGISLRYIQELLGHSDLKTTKGYLHSTEKTIRDIGKKITEAREEAAQSEEPTERIVDFKVS